MSQYDFGTINPNTKSGTDLATDLNSFRDALNTTHGGSSRPSYAVGGLIWRDTAGTPWIVYMYDGTDDIPIGTINASTNEFTPYFAGAALTTATTSVAGTVEKSTQAEMDAGTADKFPSAAEIAAYSGFFGRLASSQIFTSSNTWTRPGGVGTVLIYCIGGGGGSGGCAATGAGQVAAAGGGGGGGFSVKLLDVSAISSALVTIGAGGVAGTAGANNGSNGGSTSFGSSCVSGGGTGGNGGTVGTGDGPNVSGGTGGAVTTADWGQPGDHGGTGVIFGSSGLAIGGGGGSGGGIGGGAPKGTPVAGTSTGGAGSGYGSGASGSANGVSQSATAGAAGAPGLCVVYEFS